MTILRSGFTLSAVALAATVTSPVSANVAQAPDEDVKDEYRFSDPLMRTYSTTQEAIAVLQANKRQDLLTGTVSDFTNAVGNPSSNVKSDGWYALIGDKCCLVVLDAVASAAKVLVMPGDMSLSEALQQVDEIALSHPRSIVRIG